MMDFYISRIVAKVHLDKIIYTNIIMLNCRFNPKCRYGNSMDCCLSFSVPGRLGTKGSKTNNGCGVRLRELNSAKKPSPTKLQGSQVARENYIRRRVAVIKQIKNCLSDDQRFKGEECNETYAYGPVFGFAKNPKRGGKCNNVYSANGGSGSDVIQWRRLYGGSRQLFNTASCKYACSDQITADRLV